MRAPYWLDVQVGVTGTGDSSAMMAGTPELEMWSVRNSATAGPRKSPDSTTSRRPESVRFTLSYSTFMISYAHIDIPVGINRYAVCSSVDMHYSFPTSHSFTVNN